MTSLTNAVPAGQDGQRAKEPFEYDNHHGQTVAAWTGVTIALVGVLVGSAGLLTGSMPVMVAGGVVLVAACVVGKVLQLMGLGQTDHPARAGRRSVAAAEVRPADERSIATETSG